MGRCSVRCGFFLKLLLHWFGFTQNYVLWKKGYNSNLTSYLSSSLIYTFLLRGKENKLKYRVEIMKWVRKKIGEILDSLQHGCLVHSNNWTLNTARFGRIYKRLLSAICFSNAFLEVYMHLPSLLIDSPDGFHSTVSFFGEGTKFHQHDLHHGWYFFF